MNDDINNINQTCKFVKGDSSNLSNASSHNHSHIHDSLSNNEHGHTHEKMDDPGRYIEREPMKSTRQFDERAFTIGIGGPVGSGKTALMLALCQKLQSYNIACVTNDIFTQEDAEYLIKHNALNDNNRIKGIETGGCPHAAIREDISMNLNALEQLHAKFNTNMLLIESGGDNLAANYSRELADYIIYVIDVSAGDKIPRKGGPGITQSDLLVINKIDIAHLVDADLNIMKRDADKMRDGGPTIFAQVKHDVGVDQIVEHILRAWEQSGARSQTTN